MQGKSVRKGKTRAKSPRKVSALEKMLNESCPGLDYIVLGPHHIDIPKTPVNEEKLWRVGLIS